jgi:tRNA (uracil-5-)-methyltransferase TRM9
MDQQRADEILNEVRTTYNDIASEFSDTRTSLWDELKPFTENVSDGMAIADIGCGNGRLLQLLQGKKVTYAGIDNSGKLLRKAQQYAATFPEVKTKFYEADMRHLPLQNDAFDMVLCIATLHHLPTEEHRKIAAAELHRICKKNGTLIMTNWYLSAQPKYVLEQARQRLSHPRMYATMSFRDFFVPWTMRDKTVKYRYYYAFTPSQLKHVLHEVGFSTIANSVGYGERDWSGMRTKRNILTIAKK